MRYFLGFLLFFSYSLALANSKALIVVIDLAETAAKHKKMYRGETRKAVKTINHITKGHYAKTIILHGIEASQENFINQLKVLASDDSITTIDAIIYIHGKNESYVNGPSVCFVDRKDCTNVHELSIELNLILNLNPKLRMLYSDACWGETHMQAWLDAGFLVASGSKGVDSNRSIDLKRFLKKWVKGESFETSINHANGSFISDIMDAVIKNGNSHKEMLGDSKLTIQD